MTGYAVMVGFGIVAAAIVARVQPDSVALPSHMRSALALAALGG